MCDHIVVVIKKSLYILKAFSIVSSMRYLKCTVKLYYGLQSSALFDKNTFDNILYCC